MVTHEQVSLWMAIILYIQLTAIGLWDLYCYYRNTPTLTVSAVVGQWARDMPLTVLLAGIVLGHLYFSVRCHPGPKP